MQKLDKLSDWAFQDKHTPEAEAKAMRREHRKPKLSETERMLRGFDEEYRQKAAKLLASIDLRKLRKLADDLENALREKSMPFETLQLAIDSKALFEESRKLAEDILDIKMRDPRQEQEVG